MNSSTSEGVPVFIMPHKILISAFISRCITFDKLGIPSWSKLLEERPMSATGYILKNNIWPWSTAIKTVHIAAKYMLAAPQCLQSQSNKFNTWQTSPQVLALLLATTPFMAHSQPDTESIESKLLQNSMLVGQWRCLNYL